MLRDRLAPTLAQHAIALTDKQKPACTFPAWWSVCAWTSPVRNRPSFRIDFDALDILDRI